jgi:hypothetical protein
MAQQARRRCVMARQDGAARKLKVETGESR